MATLSPLLGQATPAKPVNGEGVYLYDADGTAYLDFTAGIGVTSTGHCHPTVVAAVQEQAGQLLHGQYTTVLHPRITELSTRLGEVLPKGIDSLFYASAGTEAVEAAVRLARHATGRPNIVSFVGGFHGRTMGSLSLTTSKTALRAGLQPLMGGVVTAPFPFAYRYGLTEDEATAFALRELDFLLAGQSAPDETAAFVIEPILGEGGFVPAPAAFLQGLRERADRHGILLVIDEVQAGFGRTGRFWGHQESGATPDILVTAKGLASGMPLSAMAAPEALMAKGWPGSQGGTYGGNPVACAAAIATLDVFAAEDLVGNAATVGAHLRQRLDGLATQFDIIGDVRGRGLMLATEIIDAEGAPDPVRSERIRAAAGAERLLLLPCGTHGNVIRWLPPLVVTTEQVDDAIGRFTKAIEAT